METDEEVGLSKSRDDRSCELQDIKDSDTNRDSTALVRSRQMREPDGIFISVRYHMH